MAAQQVENSLVGETRRLTLGQKLGAYLVVAGLLEAGALFLTPSPRRAPFVTPQLPPRGGILILVLRQLPPTLGRQGIIWVEGSSACWLMILGILLVRRKSPLKTYIVSEVLLSAPTLWAGIVLIFTGGGHIYFPEHGFMIVLMVTLFSAIPVLLAFRALKENRFVQTVSP